MKTQMGKEDYHGLQVKMVRKKREQIYQDLVMTTWVKRIPFTKPVKEALGMKINYIRLKTEGQEHTTQTDHCMITWRQS